MISINDIHWIAGFLEGEGSFYGCEPFPKRGAPIEVSASQVQKWPLEKLNSIIPGTMRLRKKNSPTSSIWIWYANTANSAGLMMTIYSLMSPKRKEQIERALFFWRIRVSSRWKYRTHCIHGHEINEMNTYIYKGTKRCKPCMREISLAHSRKRKSLRKSLLK